MDANKEKFHFMEIQEGDDGECILILKDDNSKELQYVDTCYNEEYPEEIINITSDKTCQECQTESCDYNLNTFLFMNIPIIFCSQPAPCVASTQCNIPLKADACVGTDSSDPYCTENFQEREKRSDEDETEALDGHCEKSLVEKEILSPRKKGMLRTTGTENRGSEIIISRRGRPRKHMKKGATFKYKRKVRKIHPKTKKDVETGSNVHSESVPSKSREGRRIIKKIDADFEYEFGDSEEELEIKLEADDDNDKDWKEGSEGVSDIDDDQKEAIEKGLKELGNMESRVVEFREEDDENLDQLLRSKEDGNQLDFFSNQKASGDDSVSVIKKELDEDIDYKSFIDAVVWKSDIAGDNDLYCNEETGLIDGKQIQTVGVDELDHDQSEKLSERIKKYMETSRKKYHQERVIKSDGKKVFKCLKCNKEFAKRLLLTEHRKVHSRKLRVYNCNHCGKVFHEARKYFSHLSLHERMFECNSCGRKFSLLANLKKHIVLHHDAKKKVCEVCGMQFSSDNELTEHQQSQHSEDIVSSYIAKCKYCNREYRREEAYIQHMNRAPYNCSTCNKSCGCEFELKKHIRYEHGHCVCEFCGKSFKNNSILNHIKVMHKEAPVQCLHCPKKFVYRSRMLAHIDSCHNAEKKYKCNQCSYSAKTANSLNLHRRRCHLDPKELKWYECDICNKKFYLPSKLTVHYRAHTGEKPFSCQTCGKTFACKYNKKEHERAVHGERIEVKNQDGSTLVQMVKHRRAPRATGRRCDICSIDFSSTAAIIEHMKKVHTLQSTESMDENSKVKVSVKYEPQEESGDKCLEYEVIANAGDVILSDSSSMMNIRADEIPQNATVVEIDGVEYQVVRQ
ncbi:zinc finger protein 23-like [Palaemon carinicauda]|uniref:zinc finger protein 23-like n=1 Tax=Palaemon carinicauda TaxID=392227 RepID=UPI0035B572F2